MLGEDHSLLKEFSEHKATIEQLVKNDESFANDTDEYNKIDRDIRQLELNRSPISDEAMHNLKHKRSVLKDSLYQRLLAASKG